MTNINIENIPALDIDGSDLFQDSESFITELDDNGASIVAGCAFTDGGFTCAHSYCCSETLVIGTIAYAYCGDTARCDFMYYTR